MGDGFLVELEEIGALPGPRRSASSASPTRPTSTSRNRPSASSATWPAWASMPSSVVPGIQTGDLVRIGGAELEWERDPWEER